MKHQGQSMQDHLQSYKDWNEANSERMKYWRSWGSWFSWGSPVGLGLFFLAAAGTIWILGQTFHW